MHRGVEPADEAYVNDLQSEQVVEVSWEVKCEEKCCEEKWRSGGERIFDSDKNIKELQSRRSRKKFVNTFYRVVHATRNKYVDECAMI